MLVLFTALTAIILVRFFPQLMDYFNAFSARR
jgi:hypothetical protein